MTWHNQMCRVPEVGVVIKGLAHRPSVGPHAIASTPTQVMEGSALQTSRRDTKNIMKLAQQHSGARGSLDPTSLHPSSNGGASAPPNPPRPRA